MRLLQLLIAAPLIAQAWFANPSAQTEWQAIRESLGVAAWHQAEYRGQGVNIGIIDVGFAGIAEYAPDAQSPAHSPIETLNTGPSAHGTWVYEVLAQIAPDADYFLFALDPNGRNLTQAVDFMLANQVQVVNYSASTLDIPLDGTNFQAQQMGRLADANIVVVTSAGNHGVGYLADTFRDHNNDGWHEFEGGYAALWANPLINASFGETHLRWQDDYTSAQLDLDLYILTPGGEALWDASTDVQKGRSADWPYEDAFYPITAGQPFSIAIRAKHVGSVPEGTPFYLYADQTQLDPDYASPLGSLTAPADSPKVLAVGAIDADWELWWRSSRGPTWDGRIKPDIVSFTGLPLTSLGDYFIGTSASSPLVAGMVALVRQRWPALTEAEVRHWLLEHPQDLGDPGPDNLFGYGAAWLPAPVE